MTSCCVFLVLVKLDDLRLYANYLINQLVIKLILVVPRIQLINQHKCSFRSREDIIVLTALAFPFFPREPHLEKRQTIISLL